MKARELKPTENSPNITKKDVTDATKPLLELFTAIQRDAHERDSKINLDGFIITIDSDEKSYEINIREILTEKEQENRVIIPAQTKILQ